MITFAIPRKSFVKDFFDVMCVVAYPYLDDPFDDIDNQDKYLLQNYNNTSYAGFSFTFNGVNNYYSQFCKYVPFINGSVGINEKLSHSYNQQLYISIFNIINSYSNQNDNIWNDINYLQYFYHLFPTHINNFYSFLYLSVYSKIDELNGSIDSLDHKSSSFNNIIFYLAKIEKTIKNLAEHIDDLADKSNRTIDLSDGFKFLVEAIYSQLCNDIARIKELERKSNIEQELCKKLKEIKNRVEKKRCEIVKKLKEHEDDTKKKIYDHTKPLMAELYSFYRGPDPEARRLNDNIKHLIQHGGKLKQLQSFVGRISTTLVYYRDLGRILKDRHARYTQESINEIKSLLDEIKLLHSNEQRYRNHIAIVINRLERISRILDDESLINDILYNIGYLSKEDIGKYSTMVNSDIASLGRFKAIYEELGVMSSAIDSTEKANSSVQRAKRFINSQCSLLSERLVSIFSGLEAFHVGELYAIKSSIETMKPTIFKISIYLSNTENLFGYLELVTGYRTRLESLKIEEPETPYGDVLLSKVKELMNESFSAQVKITEKRMEIRRTLERTSRREAEHSEYIRRYSPGVISLGTGVVNEILSYITRLKKIVEFKGVLDKITHGLEFGIIKSQLSKMGDIDETIAVLLSIGLQLGQKYPTINSAVSDVRSNYGKNKLQIDGNSLGDGRNGIQKHVESIGTIPGEMIKLLYIFKWSIVCLGIAGYIIKSLTSHFKCSIMTIISILKTTTRLLPRESVNGHYNSDNRSTSLINTTLANSGGPYESIWAILSHITLMESKFVVSRLYECHKKKEEINKILEKVVCECSIYFGCEDKFKCIKEMLSHENMAKTLHKSDNKEINKEQNHICMCLVIRFVFYPSIIKCLTYIKQVEFDLLSSMSRKFEILARSSTLDPHRSKLAWFFLEKGDRVFVHIKEKYLTHFLITPYGRFHCFCLSPKDESYFYFISTMLFICFLVQDMFRVDCKDVEERTRHMTPLLSDLDLIGSYCSKDQSLSTDKERPCHTQNSTRVKLTRRKYLLGGMHYIMVRRTNHPAKSKMPVRWLSGPRRKNEYLTAYKLMLSVSCEPFEKDNFGIETAFAFVNIEKIKEEAERLSKSGCVSSGIVNNGNEIETVKCKRRMILGICLNMVSKDFDLIKMQISGNSILYMVLEPEYSSDKSRIGQIVKTTNEEVRKITISIRTHRIGDSTSGIRSNKFEGASNNHYSYNDAYRINTSRAHGSLKYIIIKIVLILIIVVMTCYMLGVYRYQDKRRELLNSSCFETGFQSKIS